MNLNFKGHKFVKSTEISEGKNVLWHDYICKNCGAEIELLGGNKTPRYWFFPITRNYQHSKEILQIEQELSCEEVIIKRIIE